MYEKYAEETKKIINRCHNLAVSQNEYIIGSEHLLLALFKEYNSSCHILLSEYGVTEEKLRAVIDGIVLFRKGISGLVIYTPSLKQIFERAVILKNLTNSPLVYEEHLFYTLLETKQSIAHEVLRRLNINIEALQEEMMEVMEWSIDPEHHTEQKIPDPLEAFPFVTHLNQLLKERPMPPLVMRDDILQRINTIIHKKYKRNVLLIGNAGVGKTAIVEGLAAYYNKEAIPKHILSLNVNSLISGTKYRGDLEKRIDAFLNEIKNKSEYILFIDEIHNVVNQSGTDAGIDLANIIKPALSRDEICCIGATTLTEYHKYIAKDSAFSRRFIKIFVDEPSLEETITILSQIKSYYEDYHHVSVSYDIVHYICHVSDKFITNNHFPDKAIDLLDEACALCRNLNEPIVQKHHINRIINQMNHNVITRTIKEKLKQYPFLAKPFLRYYSANKADYRPIASILCENISETDLDWLIDDIKTIFNIKGEGVKIIDLHHYSEPHSIANLLGAPPGYIGYDNENTLTKFVNKYQKAIIVFKHLDDPLPAIKHLIQTILKSGLIEDLSSNRVYFTNTIIIGTIQRRQQPIGYIDDKAPMPSTTDLPFDHTIRSLPDPKPEDITADYHTIFHNYLSCLKQMKVSVDLSGLYEDTDLTPSSLESLEHIITELWLDETDRREVTVIYNKEAHTFEICRKTG